MVEVNRIYNEDCLVFMDRLDKDVDVILTSPFYNTNKKGGKSTTLKTETKKEGYYSHVRYDTHVDNMTNEEYNEFTVELFNKFDKVLSKDGVILYNLSYGSENVEGMFLAINAILTETPFTLADVIVWKKSTAMPNNMSPNKLTRIVEYIFVICRKDEFKTFKANKKVASVRKNGQKNYENVYNFIEAKNNDKSTKLNKATYSTELCVKLLNMYAPEGSLVYDPFMGTGTTANACIVRGYDFIGTELSEEQCKYAEKRLEETSKKIMGENT